MALVLLPMVLEIAFDMIWLIPNNLELSGEKRERGRDITLRSARKKKINKMRVLNFSVMYI